MHTFLSDGVLSPVELIRRAHVAGYRVMAITDHVGAGNLEYVLNTLGARLRRWPRGGGTFSPCRAWR